jgi:hypothetical protein
MKRKVVLKRLFHREKWSIAIVFDYDEMLKAKVKSIAGSAYSSTHSCFYVDDSEENLKLILKTLRDVADVDISSLTKRERKSGDPEVQPEKKDPERTSSDNQLPDDEDVEELHLPKTIREVYGEKTEKTVYQTDDCSRYGPVEFRISEREG